jgi:hypothetical protein
MQGLFVLVLSAALSFPTPVTAQIKIPTKRTLGAPSLVYEPPALTYQKPQTAYKPPVIRQPVTSLDCNSAGTTRRCVKDAPTFSSGR